jgi:hypothetical protein
MKENVWSVQSVQSVIFYLDPSIPSRAHFLIGRYLEFKAIGEDVNSLTLLTSLTEIGE